MPPPVAVVARRWCAAAGSAVARRAEARAAAAARTRARGGGGGGGGWRRRRGCPAKLSFASSVLTQAIARLRRGCSEPPCYTHTSGGCRHSGSTIRRSRRHALHPQSTRPVNTVLSRARAHSPSRCSRSAASSPTSVHPPPSSLSLPPSPSAPPPALPALPPPSPLLPRSEFPRPPRPRPRRPSSHPHFSSAAGGDAPRRLVTEISRVCPRGR